MINSGTVQSDKSTFTTTLQKYQTEISGLDATWKGLSHDNLISKAADFYSEYSSTIAGEMDALATACDLYEQYKNVKLSLQEANQNYNIAVTNKDNARIGIYNSQITSYEKEKQSLKSQIESNLKTASATTLSASSNSGTISANAGSNNTGGLTSTQLDTVLKSATSQLGLPYNSMHYGPKEGDGQGFGCAMFVSYCYNNALFGGASAQSKGLGGFYGSTYEYWGNVTRDGYDAYNKKFVEVSPEEAKAGDVVAFLKLNAGTSYYDSYANCEHVGLYEGDGKMIESTPGAGVSERNIDVNQENIRFLHYTGNTQTT